MTGPTQNAPKEEAKDSLQPPAHGVSPKLIESMINGIEAVQKLDDEHGEEKPPASN